MLSGSRTLLSPKFSYYHHHCHHHLHHQYIPRCQFHLALHLYSSDCCKNHAFSISQSLNQLSSSYPPLIARPAAICSSFSARRFGFFSSRPDNRGSNDDTADPLVNCIHPTQCHPLSGCLSQNDDSQQPPSERLSPVAGGTVALGKFDALHIGHRELAIQASKVGVPFLLSFAGMAEVLGWEPRAPIVAKCDRKRVLNSWAPYCGSLTPREFQIDFSKVRSLTPRQFVEKLSVELGVRGVVAGENYRFGYRATGDTSDLVRLCQEYGMDAFIISSVMDKNQNPGGINSSNLKEQGQVSSTRVRYALSEGRVEYVSELLGRHHRLMLNVNHQEGTVSGSWISAPKSCLLNLPPGEGSYEKCSLVIGDKEVLPCRVIIDTTHIHMELFGKLATSTLTSQELQLLGIDFGQQS